MFSDSRQTRDFERSRALSPHTPRFSPGSTPKRPLRALSFFVTFFALAGESPRPTVERLHRAGAQRRVACERSRSHSLTVGEGAVQARWRRGVVDRQGQESHEESHKKVRFAGLRRAKTAVSCGERTARNGRFSSFRGSPRRGRREARRCGETGLQSRIPARWRIAARMPVDAMRAGRAGDFNAGAASAPPRTLLPLKVAALGAGGVRERSEWPTLEGKRRGLPSHELGTASARSRLTKSVGAASCLLCHELGHHATRIGQGGARRMAHSPSFMPVGRRSFPTVRLGYPRGLPLRFRRRSRNPAADPLSYRPRARLPSRQGRMGISVWRVLQFAQPLPDFPRDASRKRDHSVPRHPPESHGRSQMRRELRQTFLWKNGFSPTAIGLLGGRRGSPQGFPREGGDPIPSVLKGRSPGSPALSRPYWLHPIAQGARNNTPAALVCRESLGHRSGPRSVDGRPRASALP